MLIRTHLAITLFFVILLFQIVDYKAVFVIVAIIATYLPDADTRFSKIGRKKAFRILQWFTRHRGFFHSFTFLIVLSFIFLLLIPRISLGFFLGYGLHLIADGFNVSGIRPFWPLNFRLKGKIRTGGIFEFLIFMSFLVFDLILFLMVFS